MQKTKLSYAETRYESQTILDYLAEKESLKSFYGRFPELENFKIQMAEKAAGFKQQSREVLVQQLKQQYAGFKASAATQANINSLLEPNTFTVATGHQLNLFTGPLYFLYKIFSVINLAEQLNISYPKTHTVPLYWMATEDHDFEEINHFNFRGKKVPWNRKDGGAVGELTTEGLEELSKLLQKTFGVTPFGKRLLQLFKDSYCNHKTLDAATRFLGNELFKEYGLVIIDGNDANLKKAFIPYAEKELLQQTAYKKVTETTERLLHKGYKEQVHPREINLFYLKEGIRERIVEVDQKFYVNETDIVFTKEAILQELQQHPERFSPNALLRPLFQEVILPNLCYTGGGGELAYWFQLKNYFEEVKVPFPILLRRNSVLLISEKESEKLKKLEVAISHLFQKQEALEATFTKKVSEIKIDFTPQKELLKNQFEDLYVLAKKTDASFKGAVGAQEKKQINGLEYLEKRLLKAQKRKLSEQLERLTEIQDSLFPNQNLQERVTNFSEFYLDYGDDLFTVLKENLDPLCHDFTILEF
ncbi:bacillithiol biosynthesis cysteine-adding enzyme BshC [Patiriisocius sp. Uisw_017]|jgi:bacillithiol biosynthesis cysteine-adding enzyme BshC|uniref:bacillithiol biosynthesis cysteine-adding enzyme BshC n=1 Tax=Patiriisocius sp. Uisw_017 TaxID=3230968 RepID=UPI0039ED49DA